jgi:hypothetical protein
MSYYEFARKKGSRDKGRRKKRRRSVSVNKRGLAAAGAIAGAAGLGGAALAARGRKKGPKRVNGGIPMPTSALSASVRRDPIARVRRGASSLGRSANNAALSGATRAGRFVGNTRQRISNIRKQGVLNSAASSLGRNTARLQGATSDLRNRFRRKK